MIRHAGPQDVRFLRDMLKHAYHWRLNADPDLPVARYVNNWGRPGDAGLVAWEAGPVGAAWYRLFPASAPGFGFVDEETPELTIAVVPSRRGSGLGGEILAALLERAREEGHQSTAPFSEAGRVATRPRSGLRSSGPRLPASSASLSSAARAFASAVFRRRPGFRPRSR